MKRIYSFIALIAAVAMFTACGSDDASYKATPTLEITAADVLFEAEGGDGSIILNTNDDVVATTDANWLTLSVEGSKVIVTADPNLSLEGRNGVIKLRAGNTEAEVTATQKSSLYGVPSLEYEIGDYQASLSIPVVHSQDVTVESQTSWLTAVWNEETNQIEIVAEDNDEVEPREGTIILTMGDYSDEITITQRGFLLELAEEELSLNDEEQTVTVKVNHSRAIASVESHADWISAKFNASDNTLICKVAANDSGWERSGTVTITSGPVTRTLTISQFDYETDVYGEYDLLFCTETSGANDKWMYYTADLTEDALTVHLSSTTDFILPVIHDSEYRTIYVGPTLSYIGDYAGLYAVRFHIGFVYNSRLYYTYALTTQNNTYCYATFTDIEYSDGSTSAVANFTGDILSSGDFIGWSFYAYNDPELTESANMVGHVRRLYYPYLEKVLTEAPSDNIDNGAKQHRTAKRNTTAPLGSKENPIPAYNQSCILAK